MQDTESVVGMDALTLFPLLIPVALAMVGVPIVIVALVTEKPLGVVAVALATVFLEAVLGQRSLSVPIGSVSVFPLDLLACLLVSGAVLRLVAPLRRLHAASLLLLVLAGIAVARLLAGISKFGLERAVSHSRPYIYFLSAALFTAALPASEALFRRLVALWSGLTLGLLAVALVRWAFVAAGGQADPVWMSSGGLPTRVLHSHLAFVLAQALVLARYAKHYGLPMPGGRFLRFALPLAIVALLYRSVWVVTIFGILLTSLRERRFQKAAAWAVAMVGVATVGLVLFVATASTPGAAASAVDLSTFAWRVEGWRSLLGQVDLRDPVPVATGRPMGAGYARYHEYGEVTVSPHNYYLQVFLDFGAAGLVALIGAYLILLLVLRRAGPGQAPARIMFALLAMQLAFFIPWSPHLEQGILLGCGVGIARTSDRRSLSTRARGATSLPHA